MEYTIRIAVPKDEGKIRELFLLCFSVLNCDALNGSMIILPDLPQKLPDEVHSLYSIWTSKGSAAASSSLTSSAGVQPSARYAACDSFEE